MSWKDGVNQALRSTLGYELQRAAGGRSSGPAAARSGPHRKRLVPDPVFVLTSVRSGSTLLRLLLDSHSQVRAPHEMHLRRLRVQVERSYALLAVETAGLSVPELEHLLWDRLLERELSRSGKRVIVDKTPSNVLMWKRLSKAWPRARFVFLLRHPAAIADSWQRAHLKQDEATVDTAVLRYMDAIEAARAVLPGHTVRYEELTADPSRVLQGLCEFLGVDFEPAMLDYGAVSREPLKRGIGDWSPKIRSGAVQPAPPLPPLDQVRPSLVRMVRTWGYAD